MLFLWISPLKAPLLLVCIFLLHVILIPHVPFLLCVPVRAMCILPMCVHICTSLFQTWFGGRPKTFTMRNIFIVRGDRPWRNKRISQLPTNQIIRLKKTPPPLLDYSIDGAHAEIFHLSRNPPYRPLMRVAECFWQNIERNAAAHHFVTLKIPQHPNQLRNRESHRKIM